MPGLPDPEQAAVFNRTFGCVRLVWNKTLAERHAAFFQRGEKTSYQQTAFANFFAKRARYPRFKSRTGKQSAHYTRSAFRIKDGQVHAAKTGGPLRIAWARIANPRHLARKGRNLARYQRQMARKQRGSANRRKARTTVAVAHHKVRNARRDFLHKTSTAIIEVADTIVLEDLAVAKMVRNRSLSKVVSDVGWAEFRSLLEYKAARAGRHLIVIDRWYPSSKTCSACGHLLPTPDLGTRHWTCPACRTRHDRDINAAKNILAAGRAVAGEPSGDACRADVRQQGSSLLRSAVKQEPHAARRPA